MSSRSIPTPEDVEAYITWLRGQPTGLNLIGVAGGDMPLDLNEVYVPLSFSHGHSGLHLHDSRSEKRDDLQGWGNNFDLLDLFARIEAHVRQGAHALILGGAGTGKTTALYKLVQLCLPSPFPTGPDTIHLAVGYVPVFVSLGRFTRADLQRPLGDFLQDELARRAKDHERIVAAMLMHPRLLVLLDGLDEIADRELRGDFCAHLSQQLTRQGCSKWRVVITSRPAGYGRDRCCLPKRDFAEVFLQPLGREQVPLLVERWFQEAARRMPEYGQERATRDAEELKGALTHPSFGQRMEVMFATPLLLTLLCVVVQRGRKMPDSRAKFYDECLHVLLERWHSAKDRDVISRTGGSSVAHPGPEGLLDAEVAIRVLQPIAYELHLHETRDELTADELVLKILKNLRSMQCHEDPDNVLQWLRDRAEVIVEFGEGSGRLGFFHLHIQEYLAALHIEREGLFDELALRFGHEWWHEVTRLVVSIGSRRSFAALLDLLLTERYLLDVKIHSVLQELFLDAREVDLEPVRRRLEQPELPSDEILLALLRLVKGLSDPLLAASARRLAERTGDDTAIHIAAKQLAITASPVSGVSSSASVTVLAHSVDSIHGRDLVGHLRRLCMTVWPRTGEPPSFELLDRKQMKAEVSAAVLVFGSQVWWNTAAMQARIELIQQAGTRLVGVRPPGASTLVEVFPIAIDVDFSAGWDDKNFATLRQLLIHAPAGLVEEQPYIDVRTGMRFVWVPGGAVVMGSNGLGGSASPEYQVKISPFWLGETPVTNRQYELFLKATRHRRPPVWNHAQYSDPELPVVTVSWDDAMAFCVWLSEASGLHIILPSEEQWEFAARGTDGRIYPWGDEPPDTTRACFDQDFPARVGMFPNGQGPFGTVDQAGNVWEWCRDEWDNRIYALRARRNLGVPAKLTSCEDDNELRPLRGGSWSTSADRARVGLAAAFRYKLKGGSLNDGVGFRVVIEMR